MSRTEIQQSLLHRFEGTPTDREAKLIRAVAGELADMEARIGKRIGAAAQRAEDNARFKGPPVFGSR